jgi:hypothetical protein
VQVEEKHGEENDRADARAHLLAVGFILAVLLWAWTLWFQAYIYEQVTDGLAWRTRGRWGHSPFSSRCSPRNPGVQPLFDITTGGTRSSRS